MNLKTEMFDESYLTIEPDLDKYSFLKIEENNDKLSSQRNSCLKKTKNST